MKHPFWIVNSALFFFIVLALLFVHFMSYVTITPRKDIEPHGQPHVSREKVVKININKIYEHDLFGTYKKEVPTVKEEIRSLPIPEPPAPQAPIIPKTPEPKFLDPLDISLKGIIALSTDMSKNSVIIEDNKSKREAVYHVGDALEDAQIIRIFANKVMLLRSSGQQEVLYLREQDAKNDPVYIAFDDWTGVAQKIDARTFTVFIDQFLQRVNTLSAFLELFGLTTAYKQGLSVGSRIGILSDSSLPIHLGFQSGDIVTTVNDIPATDTKNRLKIYKSITAMGPGDKIIITLLRANTATTLQLELAQTEKRGSSMQAPITLNKISKQEKEQILKEKYKLAPTLNEIHQQERQYMIHGGAAPINSTIGQ